MTRHKENWSIKADQETHNDCIHCQRANTHYGRCIHEFALLTLHDSLVLTQLSLMTPYSNDTSLYASTASIEHRHELSAQNALPAHHACNRDPSTSRCKHSLCTASHSFGSSVGGHATACRVTPVANVAWQAYNGYNQVIQEVTCQYIGRQHVIRPGPDSGALSPDCIGVMIPAFHSVNKKRTRGTV